jgi:predicted ATPase/class 3 adenylate cyclase/tetratricopeptide (TPR) repeat protein
MNEHPTGTVSFLFMDIQGSTDLWERHRVQMKDELLLHDRILRKCIEAEHGYVFKTVGDAFCGAFHTAIDAVNAALRAQLTVSTTEWDLPAPFRVRMGIHTGEAVERDGDYFGPAVNRAARIEAAAHGGQTILSLVTAELVRDALADEISLSDLGAHRLKDLIRHERIYQLNHPDLPFEFPAIRSLDTRPNNLPVQPTPLIGRVKEIEEVQHLLIDHEARLVSLVGIGGIGKTRLALQIAAEMIDLLDDGTYFVDLADASDPDMLPELIARTFSLDERLEGDWLSATISHIKRKELLLVLDNFEQIIGGSKIVADLLSSCPRIMIIVTSREGLRLRGEYVFNVPPLAVPDATELRRVGWPVEQYEAVTLFLDRAVEANPNFSMTEQNLLDIAHICTRLEGIPLAIELAAARIRSLSPSDVLERLEHRLSFLTRGARDLPLRQQAIRTTLEWSYDLLDDSEGMLFGLLGVFEGGFSLDAAEAVCAEFLKADVLNTLESLVDKSLVRVISGDSAQRYSLMEVVREYSRERLEDAGNDLIHLVGSSHASFFAQYGQRAKEQTKEIKLTESPISDISQELSNLRSAFSFLLAQNPGVAAKIASDLTEFWHLFGCVREGRTWLKQSLDALGEPTEPEQLAIRATTLRAGAVLAIDDGEFSEAIWMLTRALHIHVQLGDRAGADADLEYLGWANLRSGNVVAAEEHFTRSRDGALERKDSLLAAKNLNGLGLLALRREQLDVAKAFLSEARVQFTLLQNERQEINVHINLALVTAAEGDLSGAAGSFGEVTERCIAIGDFRLASTCLNNEAEAFYHLKSYDKALRCFERLDRFTDEHRLNRRQILALAGRAKTMTQMGEAEKAVDLANLAVKRADEEGSFAERGECHRALGIGLLAMERTTAASEALDHAITFFERSGSDAEIEQTLAIHPNHDVRGKDTHTQS